MRPLHLYLTATGSWFMAFGLQSVMFAWLVTMVLRESPEKVGIAQMALLLPGTLLILVGGSLADRFGGKPIALAGQLLAMLAPLLLITVLVTGQLTFGLMLVYAVLIGTGSAFVTPGRDGLLNTVAEGRVQRVVMLTSIAQFGMQIGGIAIAYFADRVGAIPILITQTSILFIGVLALVQLPTSVAGTRHHSMLASIKEGASTVFASPAMRMVAFQNIAMALFFMGSYIVTVPLLIREVFAGSAADLALINGANAIGLVVTIVFLLRFGDVHRQGRALLLAQFVGAIVLGAAAFTNQLWLFVCILFFWGICGGLAMTMSRTIMQEQAPADQRGRVMAFYSFTFMGAGPIGALLNGFLVEAFGPQQTLMMAGVGMLLVIVAVGFISRLWQVTGPVHESV